MGTWAKIEAKITLNLLPLLEEGMSPFIKEDVDLVKSNFEKKVKKYYDLYFIRDAFTLDKGISINWVPNGESRSKFLLEEGRSTFYKFATIDELEVVDYTEVYMLLSCHNRHGDSTNITAFLTALYEFIRSAGLQDMTDVKDGYLLSTDVILTSNGITGSTLQSGVMRTSTNSTI